MSAIYWTLTAICEIKLKTRLAVLMFCVTCVGQLNEDIFDVINTTLMSNYLMVAFLPSILRRDRAYIIGVGQLPLSICTWVREQQSPVDNLSSKQLIKLHMV